MREGSTLPSERRPAAVSSGASLLQRALLGVALLQLVAVFTIHYSRDGRTRVNLPEPALDVLGRAAVPGPTAQAPAPALRSMPAFVQECGKTLPGSVSGRLPPRSFGNPFFKLKQGRVRDPAVHVLPPKNGVSRTWELYFTHYDDDPKKMFSGKTKGYSVRLVTTTDWGHFTPPVAVTPHGYASPDAPVEWHGREILALQAYPDHVLGGPKSGLFYMERRAGTSGGWSTPRPFLTQAVDIPRIHPDHS